MNWVSKLSRDKIESVVAAMFGAHDRTEPVNIFAVAAKHGIKIAYSTKQIAETKGKVLIRPNYTISEAKFQAACHIALKVIEAEFDNLEPSDELIDAVAAKALVPAGFGKDNFDAMSDYEIKARYNLPSYGFDALKALWVNQNV